MIAPAVPEPLPQPDGAEVLDLVYEFTGRYVAYPSEHAHVAHVLWIGHTYFMECWDSTPRLAFLSPEPGSGKSRGLEVTAPLVPRPVHAVNATPAYLFRKVSDEAGLPTILYDEIDTVFGPKAKDNEDVRAMLNAGHRRGANAGRCVTRGTTIETEEFPAYCAVALAGLNDLPDTIQSRAIVLRMRRRAPSEHVQPWRERTCGPEAEQLADRLAAWADSVRPSFGTTWPEMPAGVEDRDADVWEAILAVANAAGGRWPDAARDAAVALVSAARESSPSLGVQLLHDIRSIFTGDTMFTVDLLDRLHRLEESPWSDLRGKPIDHARLARELKRYDVRPRSVRQAGKVAKGYHRSDFVDPWERYLPSDVVSRLEAVTAVTPDTNPRECDGVSPVTALRETAGGHRSPPDCPYCRRNWVFKSGPCPEHRRTQ